MSNNNKNNTKIASGIIWSYSERIASQLITTVVAILLARMLDPEFYGIISIVTIFITFCDIFVTSGFSSALVQKKDADELDFNSVFIMGLIISLVLYVVLYTSSPFIAEFYEIDQLKSIIRIMSIRLPIASLSSVQQAYVQRKMEFKRFFYSTLGGNLASAGIGLIMAMRGYGVWSLVAQNIINTIVNSIILFFTAGWKPKLMFSYKRVKSLFSYGSRVLATTLVYTIEGDIKSLVVAKEFGSADLAYYNEGRKYPSLIISNLNTAISKVMFPAFVEEQDNIIRLKYMMIKYIQVSTFIVFPAIIGIIAVAENLILVLLTVKWIQAVPFLQILGLSLLTRPFETACNQLILAVGKSETSLRIMIIIHSVSLVSVIITVFVFNNIILLAWTSVLGTIVSLICFMKSISTLINFNIYEQLRIMFPSLALSIMMGVVVNFIKYMKMGDLITLIAQIIVGIAVYILGAIIFRNQAFKLLLSIIKNLFCKNVESNID